VFCGGSPGSFGGKMETKANDTAYPAGAMSNFEETNPVGGLTKREYFAAMAMQGLLSNQGSWSPSE